MPDRTAPSPRRPPHGPSVRVTPHRTPDGKVRWIATLTPGAEATYAASVAAVVPVIERRLGPAVVADRGRLGPGARTVRLAPWEPARRRWRAMARRRLGDDDVRALLVGDVRDCFASIGPSAVTRALAEAGAPRETIALVVACLRAFADDGVQGLPVGPTASAVLGNAVLAGLDDVLRLRGIPHLRWVDDVLAFVPSRREARFALDALRRSAEGIGLELHDGKTRVVDDPDEARTLVGTSNSPGAGSGVA
jgi:hypothetical protein